MATLSELLNVDSVSTLCAHKKDVEWEELLRADKQKARRENRVYSREMLRRESHVSMFAECKQSVFRRRVRGHAGESCGVRTVGIRTGKFSVCVCRVVGS